MDNPSLSLLHQEDFSALLASYGGGAGTGDRLPLLVYKVYPDDGREEVIRGARIIGVNTRSLRNLAGIGNDDFVYNYMQSQITGFAGTALGAFGAAQGGLPASVVAPSLLFEELEVRGARGEPKRLPLIPAPPLTAAPVAQTLLYVPAKTQARMSRLRERIYDEGCSWVPHPCDFQGCGF